MRLPAYQDLSKEQDRINDLPLDGSHLVVGPPGTGKTVMALYRAQRLHKAGRPVVLLTHNRLLMQYTDAAIKELSISGVVQTFWSWFGTWHWKQFRTNLPQRAPYDLLWDDIWQSVNSNPPRPGDVPYLIIDEGQDIPKQFYTLARMFATNITVFADENQIITEKASRIDDIRAYGGFGATTHRLNRNYRNTKEIAAVSDVFATSSTTGVADPPTRSGPTPTFAVFDKTNSVVEHIARFEKAYNDLEIGVLVPTSDLRKSYVNRLEKRTANPVQTFEGGKGKAAVVVNFDTAGIKVITYASAKGLEFDAVFMPELQTVENFTTPVSDMKLYVMTSRAREHLFLSSCGEGLPVVADRFPKEHIEWSL
jgi:DNA helicase IV